MDATSHHQNPSELRTSARDGGVTEALELLSVVLAAADSTTVDVALVADVAEVVDDLLGVRPPLPPLIYPEHGPDDDEHALAFMAHAARRLSAAAVGSDDPREQLRAGLAARRLRALVVRWRQ